MHPSMYTYSLPDALLTFAFLFCLGMHVRTAVLPLAAVFGQRCCLVHKAFLHPIWGLPIGSFGRCIHPKGHDLEVFPISHFYLEWRNAMYTAAANWISIKGKANSIVHTQHASHSRSHVDVNGSDCLDYIDGDSDADADERYDMNSNEDVWRWSRW